MPVQCGMPVPAAAEEAFGELARRAAALGAASGGRLLECFAAVPDPRDPRGVRHSLPAVLALCTAAVLCGNTSLEDITAWVHAAPQQVLAACAARRNALGAHEAPHPDTVVRLLSALGAQPLAHHAGAYLAARAAAGPVTFPVRKPGPLPAVAVDGKAVRGAAGPDGAIPFLLAAAAHGTGIVLAERAVGAKTNEIPEFAPLLLELNEYHPLAGHVITADAHCPVTTKIPRPMLLTCGEESSLTTSDGGGVRFAGFPGGQVVARDNEDCPTRSPANAFCRLPGCMNVRADGR